MLMRREILNGQMALQNESINNKNLFIFAFSLYIKHCNPLVDTILH